MCSMYVSQGLCFPVAQCFIDISSDVLHQYISEGFVKFAHYSIVHNACYNKFCSSL